MREYTVIDVVGIDIEPGQAVTLRVGDAFNELGYSANTPMFGPANIVSVPLAPTDGDAAQAICLEGGDQRVAIAARDNRIADKGGSLNPGDTAIYTDGDAKLLVKRGAESVTMYSVGASSGNSMMSCVDGENDQILHHSGGAFIKIGQDEIVLAINGGSTFRVSKNAVNIKANTVTIESKDIRMGGTVPPGPPIPTQAAAVGPGGPINVVVPNIMFFP